MLVKNKTGKEFYANVIYNDIKAYIIDRIERNKVSIHCGDYYVIYDKVLNDLLIYCNIMKDVFLGKY